MHLWCTFEELFFELREHSFEEPERLQEHLFEELKWLQEHPPPTPNILFKKNNDVTSDKTSSPEVKSRSKSSKGSKNTLKFLMQILVFFASITSVSSTSWLSWAKVNTFDATSMVVNGKLFGLCGSAAQTAFPLLPVVPFVVGGSLCSATTSIVSDFVRPEDQDHQSFLRDNWYGAPIAAVTTSGMSSMKDVPVWLTKMAMKRIASKVMCELGPNAVLNTIYDDLEKHSDVQTEPAVLKKWGMNFASSLCNGAVSAGVNSLEIKAILGDSYNSGDVINTKFQKYVKECEANGKTPVSYERYVQLAKASAINIEKQKAKKELNFKRTEKARAVKAANLAMNEPPNAENTPKAPNAENTPKAPNAENTPNVDAFEDNTFQIFVKGIDEETITLRVTPDTKVSDVVKRIGSELYVSYGGKPLQVDDTRTIADLNIQRQATLTATGRGHGGNGLYKVLEPKLDGFRYKLRNGQYNPSDELKLRLDFAEFMRAAINGRFNTLSRHWVDGEEVPIFDDLLMVFKGNNMVEHRYAIKGYLLRQFDDNLNRIYSLLKTPNDRYWQDYQRFEQIYDDFVRRVSQVDRNTELFMTDYISRTFTDYIEYYDADNQLFMFLNDRRKVFMNPSLVEYL